MGGVMVPSEVDLSDERDYMISLLRCWRRIGWRTRALLLFVLIFLLVGAFLPGFQPAAPMDYVPPPTTISRVCDVLFCFNYAGWRPETPRLFELFLQIASVIIWAIITWMCGLVAVGVIHWFYRKVTGRN